MWNSSSSMQEDALQIEESVQRLDELRGRPLYVGRGWGHENGLLSGKEADGFLDLVAAERRWFAGLLRAMAPAIDRLERILDQGKGGPGDELDEIEEVRAYLESVRLEPNEKPGDSP